MSDNANFDIAIIGVAGIFPGASSVQQYWDNLVNGTESIINLTDAELKASGISEAEYKTTSYIKRAGVLEGFDQFDAKFFDISEKDAILMDPQQRVMLELAWSALEDAGFNFSGTNRSVGIFAGELINSYLLNNIMRKNYKFGLDITSILEPLIDSDKDFLATKLSYKFNLTGPSITVQTACSTGLVAVHLACQSLLDYECDAAVAATVSVRVPHFAGYHYMEGGIASKDGHCRPFDANASGTVFGSGAGAIVLKRLTDAIQDRDQIYAVIKGTAINNDGSNKVSYTAPSINGQQDVIIQAIDVAGINPEDIQYIETHGTGTFLGDPIEITALKNAYRKYTDKQDFCHIGSVKANIGHLDTAAGMAGLIKTILALKHELIPPCINFTILNPNITLDNSPFKINTKPVRWARISDIPRYAAVSSFGVGGTNAHVILCEAPSNAASPSNITETPQILCLSAKSESSLQALIARYQQYLTANPNTGLEDLCFTSNACRYHFKYRSFIVANTVEQLALSITKPTINSTDTDKLAPSVCFLFTGQGSQYPGLCKQLYSNNKIFKDQVDICDEILQSNFKFSIKEILWGDKQPLIDSTEYAQPAIFTVEYALYKMWRHYGIDPDVLLGHSLGEYVAACAAEIFSLEDALILIVKRAKLMQLISEPGIMVAINTDVDKAREIINPFLDKVSIAAVNGNQNIVISGSETILIKIMAELSEKNVYNKQLKVSHAFHSPFLIAIKDEFYSAFKQIKFNPPKIKIINNLNATIAADNMTNPEYWVNQMLNTIQFAKCASILIENDYVFLELGPAPTLCGLIESIAAETDKSIRCYYSLDPKKSDTEQILTSLGNIYLTGINIDWLNFYAHSNARKISIPTYAFEHKRYWFEDQAGSKIMQAGSNNFIDYFATPALPNAQIFQTRLRTAELNYLADHLVYNFNVIPASLYISMILSAGNYLSAKQPLEISNLILNQALIRNNNFNQCLQLVLSKNINNSNQQVEIYSAKDLQDSNPWSNNVSGELKFLDNNAFIEKYNVQQLINSPEAQTLDTIEFYKNAKVIGFEWRDSFQCIKQIKRLKNTIIALVELPDKLKHSFTYQLHPAFLDACLQIFILPLVADNLLEIEQHDLYLPFTIDSLSFIGGSYSKLYSIFELHTIDALNKETFSGTLKLVDEHDNVILNISAIHFKRTRRDALQALDHDNNIHYLTLHKQPYICSKHTNTFNTFNTLILCSARNEIANTISKQLSTQTSQILNLNQVQLNNDEVLEKLLSVNTDNNVILYFLESSSNLDPELILHMQTKLLAFMQILISLTANKHSSKGFKLWLINHTTDINTNYTLRGITQTFNLEYPELYAGTVNIHEFSNTSMQSLINLIYSTVIPDEYYLQNDQIETMHVVANQALTTDSLPITIKTDATYIVTGGLGGLGSVTVKWLIQHGAKNIAILTRHGSNTNLSKLFADLTAPDLNLRLFHLNIADAYAVDEVLAEIRLSMLPINGIIHAAGVISDALIPNQTAESFKSVFESKVFGAWNLHRHTQNDKLDFFFMYSSVAGVYGSIGQINYAAANNYLDALACLRRENNLPATSIDWSPWSELGMSAKLSTSGHSQSFVDDLGTISTNSGLNVLNKLLNCDLAQIIIIPDIKQLDKDGRLLINPQYGTSIDNRSSTSHVSEITNVLSDKTRSEQQSIILDKVKMIVSHILGKKEFTEQELATPLRELGLDSLHAVQARNQLNTMFEYKFHPTIFFDYPSVNLICDYILKTLSTPEAITKTTPEEKTPATPDLNTMNADELAKFIDSQVNLWNSKK